VPEEWDITGGIDNVSKATEKLALFFDSIGIELSVFAIQLSALLIAAAVFLVTATVVRKSSGVARYSAAAGLVPLAAIIGFILATWISQTRNPIPDYIAGRVISEDLHGLRIELLDFRDEPIAAGPEYVDSVTGRFGLNYQPRLGDRPRKLRLHKPGCKHFDYPIGREPLQAGQDFELAFHCEVLQ
jgi:hypothetical protein